MVGVYRASEGGPERLGCVRSCGRRHQAVQGGWCAASALPTVVREVGLVGPRTVRGETNAIGGSLHALLGRPGLLPSVGAATASSAAETDGPHHGRMVERGAASRAGGAAGASVGGERGGGMVVGYGYGAFC